MKLSRGKFLLILIYLSMIAMISFRVAVHPTSYTTHDSHFYLKQAAFIEDIFSGDNTISRLSEIKKDFSTWPVGYPLSIGIVSYFTKTSPLVASKIVNLLFMGLLCLLLYHWQGEKAWFLAISFFSYGSMEVISETWSETPFIFFVFLLGYIITNCRKYAPGKLVIALSACLIFLFLFRYVGVIYVVIIGIYGLSYLLRKNQRLAYPFLGATLFSTTFICLYLYSNTLSSGYITGMDRVYIAHQLLNFFADLCKGLLNEVFIARNYAFNGSSPDWLFLLLITLQALVVFILYKKRNLINGPVVLDPATKTLLILSLCYLGGITILKFFIPIDDFDFRILFPFTAPLFAGLLIILIGDSRKAYFEQVFRIIVLFMIISFLSGVPKKYLLRKVNEEFTEQNSF